MLSKNQSRWAPNSSTLGFLVCNVGADTFKVMVSFREVLPWQLGLTQLCLLLCEGPSCGLPLSFGVRLPSAQTAVKHLVVTSGS